MFRKLTLSAAVTLGLVASGATAEGAGGHIENVNFPFDGPFGSYDENQLQRGLKIFTENCSVCHGLRHVAIRTLGDEGGPHLPADQVRAYAEGIEVYDAELEDYRAATPADYFPEGTFEGAPDLSLMAKARAGFHGPYGLGINQLLNGIGGPEYIAALLNGYEEAPDCAPAEMSGSYNTAFTAGGYPDECKDEDGNHLYPGSWIGMPQPLYGEDVEFDDGHANDLHHEAEDIAAFLMWTAEPHLNARKRSGLTGVIFLSLLAVMLYLANKRLWAPHKPGRKED